MCSQPKQILISTNLSYLTKPNQIITTITANLRNVTNELYKNFKTKIRIGRIAQWLVCLLTANPSTRTDVRPKLRLFYSRGTHRI